MKVAHEIIKNMVRTEKGTNQLMHNKYSFKVDKCANKIEIKRAVEELYKVEVDRVNVLTVKGKKKRVRQQEGMTASWKKAIVTLKPDNRIEVT